MRVWWWEKPCHCLAVLGILYADDVGTVLRTSEEFAENTAIIVTVFDAGGFTGLEMEHADDLVTETMPDTPVADACCRICSSHCFQKKWGSIFC